MPPWGCLSAFQAERSGKLLDTRVWSWEEKLRWSHLGVASRWVVLQARRPEETGRGGRGRPRRPLEGGASRS